MSILNLFRIRHRSTAGNGETCSAVAQPHFVRLLIFCTIVSISAPILASLLFYHGLKLSLLSWPGWTVVHAHFSYTVLRLPTKFQPPALQQQQVFAFWAHAVASFLAFASLISDPEVSNDCRRTWTFVQERLLRCRYPSSAPAGHISDESQSGTSTVADPVSVIVVVYNDGGTEKVQVKDAKVPFAEL